jgi:hypothetical protein
MQTIFSQIRREIDDYLYQQIEVVPGYTFNQNDTIKRIHLYLNSRFENDVLFQGRKRIFYNISAPRKDAVCKAIDIDTKDVKLRAQNAESKIATFIAENEFKQWMKEKEIGKLINEFANDLASYGSIVAKTVNSDVENVDLRRLFLDQTVSHIKDSRFIIHEMYMTAPELREMSGKWDNVEEVISKFGGYYSPQSYADSGQVNVQHSSPYFKIYERYGEVEESELTGGNSDKMVRSLFIVAEPQSQSKDTQGNVTKDEGVILSKTKWYGDYPFEDCHYEKTKGRWLGVSPVEKLFPVQERFNELANQKRISMEISALHLFNTQSRQVPNNLRKYAESGDVIITDSPITPIANEERNLSAFQFEEASYKQLGDALSFSPDAFRGEALPASTPATNAVIQNNNINSYYQLKRENFGMFLNSIFLKHVLPNLMKDISKDHILRFMGDADTIGKLDSIISPYFVKKEVIKRVLNGEDMTAEHLQMIEQQVTNSLKKQGAERFLEITKDLYKNCEFDFDFIITNEQEDLQVTAMNTFQIINTIASNPAILDNPVTKTLLYRYADMIGVPSAELDIAYEGMQEQKAQQAQQPQQMPPQALEASTMPTQAPNVTTNA